MTDKEPLYNVQVESMSEHKLLLTMTGKRDTVIDASMRVILDSAPRWNELMRMRPTFGITISEIK